MDEQIKNNLTAALESLLFIHGEPIDLKKIAELLEIKKEDLEEVIGVFENKLKTDNSRGLALNRIGDQVQLATKPDFQKLGEKIIKEEIKENLTPAALETLSIVAYNGPMARSMVDYLRGVNSGYILRNLLVRGLVERHPDPERPYVFLYNVSFDFLKHLGLSKQEDLPEYSKYKEVLKNITGNAQ
ncbi:MAG: SMC-Scp complex subunit ScpB [bacterium]|nr:SMC-Scp complex subunit ScpB [bacterium]